MGYCTGILCHGRHLLANNWKLHQWGDIKTGKLGQILQTILVASQEKPVVVVFGTGASEKEGMKEAEFTIKYMLDNFHLIKKFDQFKNMDIERLKKFMEIVSVPETTSKNTFEELNCAGKIFIEKGVDKIIYISNPDHFSRCAQLVHQIYNSKDYPTIKQICGIQSEIGYDGSTIFTSKIIEKPHRGDDPSPDLSAHIGKYLKLSLKDKNRFIEMVKNFPKED